MCCLPDSVWHFVIELRIFVLPFNYIGIHRALGQFKVGRLVKEGPKGKRTLIVALRSIREVSWTSLFFNGWSIREKGRGAYT